MLYYLGLDNRGIGVQWFFLGVGLRDVAVVVLMGLVVRDILRPDGDVVRMTWMGVDDPAGGVLEHAPDRFVLRGLAPQRLPERRHLLGVRGGVAGGLEDDGAVGGPRHLDE
jgi:hypothetical protein